MNRPTKNAARHPIKVLPATPTPAHATGMQSYDGRARTNAGSYEQQFAMQDVQGNGQTVGWRKTVTGK